ncbi:conserved hypothetical protein [Burkholderiales bacterium 8X]|nr:conserved hypothetical protein [Burkholderiales bacterium 8X]
MTHAKLWLRVFLAGFAVILALLGITLFTPAPYGDLSRVAQLSDRYFGWRVDQPQVAPELLRGVTVDQADILVVGDSFSMSFNWQSELVKAGYRVSTVYWGSLGDQVCSDFNEWIRKGGFKGKLIIVESVEYLLQMRMDRSAACSTMTQPLLASPEPLWKMTQKVPGFAFNSGARLTAGWHTYQNMRMAKAGEVTRGLHLVQVRQVTGGCSQFSSELCERIPFLASDFENGPLTAKTVEQMKSFEKTRNAVPMLWMVIPNKSTVYLDPQFSKGFVEAFNQTGMGPDLFAFAQQQRHKVIDFYQPNDTHLSIRGLLTLGPVMLEAVRARLGASPASAT